MRKILIFSVLLVLLIPLLACAGAAPSPTQYLLRGDWTASSGRMDAPVKLGLGRLIVAPYLVGSPGIVIETGMGEVRAARQHQWAEPLQAGLRAFLSAEIGVALGYPLTGSYMDRPEWDYKVDVAIDRLHGTMDGTAVLEARYRITSGSDPEAGGEFYFSSSKPLPQEGYPGVVSAEASLLKDLTAAIAASVDELVGS